MTLAKIPEDLGCFRMSMSLPYIIRVLIALSHVKNQPMRMKNPDFYRGIVWNLTLYRYRAQVPLNRSDGHVQGSSNFGVLQPLPT